MQPEAIYIEYIVSSPNTAINAWQNPTIPILNGTIKDFFLYSFTAFTVFQFTFRFSFFCFSSRESRFQSFFKVFRHWISLADPRRSVSVGTKLAPDCLAQTVIRYCVAAATDGYS